MNRLLEEILEYVHNFFVVGRYSGTFVISNKSIDLSFLQEGQYFRIMGSVFNDGVHKYPTNDLSDETFEGVILAMAVPPAVIALTHEVFEWKNKYQSIVDSPYQSESFGGYSYTKASASSGGSSSGSAVDWKSVFNSKLNRWRKIG